MDFLVLLLAAYGITFGLMNAKVAVLTDLLKRWEFFRNMLVCPYCTGFHAGWLSWLLVRLPTHTEWPLTTEHAVYAITEAIASALAASAVCYLLDTAAQYLEDASAALSEEE